MMIYKTISGTMVETKVVITTIFKSPLWTKNYPKMRTFVFVVITSLKTVISLMGKTLLYEVFVVYSVSSIKVPEHLAFAINHTRAES